MTRETLFEVLRGTDIGLSSEQVESLYELLYPLFKPIDFQGKSVCIQVDVEGQSKDTLHRLYAYADWLRHLGAKNALFMPKGAEIKTLDLDESKIVVMRFLDSVPPREKLEEYAEWFRIAGADLKKVMFLDKSETVEIKE